MLRTRWEKCCRVIMGRLAMRPADMGQSAGLHGRSPAVLRGIPQLSGFASDSAKLAPRTLNGVIDAFAGDLKTLRNFLV